MKISSTPNPEHHLDFWLQHPALLFGCSLLFGCMSAWASAAWALYISWLRKWPFLLLMPIGAWHAYNQQPTRFEKKEDCQAYFHIQTLKPHRSPFQTHLLYRGILYLPEGTTPCCIHSHEHQQANVDYQLTGTLIARGEGPAIFKPRRWTAIPNSWSFAEWRYQTKETFRQFLKTKLPSPRTATLMGSLITGDVEDRLLRFHFNKLGLQHLLAISGFHFAAVVTFFSFIFTFFLPKKIRLILLLIAITGYFFLVGPAPAVRRSWLAAVLYLIAELTNRRTSGLNLLGVGMIAEILLDPKAGFQIGFQLSYASCAGILMLYPLFEKIFTRCIPKRNFFQIHHLSISGKQAYFALNSLRGLLALSASVNLVIAPFLLHHFQQFPLLSLVYNLFIPLLISACFFATLLSLCFAWLPGLSTALFWITDQLAFQTLKCISFPPVALDYVIGIKNLSGEMIPLYLFTVFCLCLKLKQKDILLDKQGKFSFDNRSTPF